jgi:hypothetical protein
MGMSYSKELERYDAILLFRELLNFYEYQKIFAKEDTPEYDQIEEAIDEIRVYYRQSQGLVNEKLMRPGHNALKKCLKKLRKNPSFVRYEQACLTWDNLAPATV